jgi:protein phosphatase inhibitor 2
MSSPPSYSESPNAKKPCKGILKSSSFDKQFGASNRKSAKFDEINVLQTYHPPNKDYGHMRVDEPKTPYNYLDPRLAEQDELDATVLTEKLKVAQETQRRASLHCEESDEELPETDDQREKRIEFEKRRKLHYNEASAIKLARKLIEEEIEENLPDDEIDEAAGGSIEDSNDELDNDETAIVEDLGAGTSSDKPSQSTDV